MDFSYSEDQQAMIDLARQILGDHCTHERLRALESSATARFDRELWRRMGEAGLLAIAVPEEFGGAGLGFLELAAIVEQVGRRTAPVPYLETCVLGILPIAQFGSDAQKRELLTRAARAESVLTAALVEPLAEPQAPLTRATRTAGGWKLDGIKICVPAGQLADHILVPAQTSQGTGVFVVAAHTPGVRITALETTSGQPEARIELSGVEIGEEAALGRIGEGAAIVEWIVERANAALCSLALGVCDEALRLTAEYVKNRKQFDQPIAMFQAVAHRAADAYVDTEAIRLTSLHAAWRIGAGMPAAPQVAAAKLFAAEAGQRVVHAAQHLHGGIGVDRDYPLHRYFLYARQLELTLGGATHHLRRLGQMIAAGTA